MQKIIEHKDYIIGILVIVAVGALFSTFGAKSLDFPPYIHLPMTILMVPLMCSIVAVIVLGLSWVFTKNFTFTRFIKITTAISFLWTLATIISTLKN